MVLCENGLVQQNYCISILCCHFVVLSSCTRHCPYHFHISQNVCTCCSRSARERRPHEGLYCTAAFFSVGHRGKKAIKNKNERKCSWYNGDKKKKRKEGATWDKKRILTNTMAARAPCKTASRIKSLSIDQGTMRVDKRTRFNVMKIHPRRSRAVH